MIARLIHWCIDNRLLVLLVTGALTMAGVWATLTTPVDAIPDLSDTQVILRTQYPGQGPRVVEEQVTYPLTTAMLSVPGAQHVRGSSMFGTSFVYVIFEDGTDPYWARSRVLEQLSSVAGRLPEGVVPQLGPDATGVGWVYEYVLLTGRWCPEHPQGLWHDPAGGAWYASAADAPEPVRDRLEHHRVFDEDAARCPLGDSELRASDLDLAQLRSIQDWQLRYELSTVEGVSEVASAGGFVKQYQVVVDPVRLRAHGVTLGQVKRAIQGSNQDVGGRVVELAETEFMVRGRGYLGGHASGDRTAQVIADLEKISLGVGPGGAPIYLSSVAGVSVGPELRRGIIEWNGAGETVAGIVVMRYGENARAVIERVRHKLADLERSLPPGVEIQTAYDRGQLIDRSVSTLRRALTEEMLVVGFATVLFLLHARSALVAVCVLPIGVLMSLLLMRSIDVSANVMSLGGVALAIGVMVDSSIVMVENAHKHLERKRHDKNDNTPHARTIARAAAEVGPSLFFSLLILTVSFLPVFALGGESGRLFKPLALTKTFAMAAAAVAAVTLIPVLMVYFVRSETIPRTWGRRWRWAMYSLGIFAPALLLGMLPLPTLDPYRTYLVVGWLILSGIVLLPQGLIDERRNPFSRFMEALYNPAFAMTMKLWWLAIPLSALLVLATLYPASRLGWEFMPPLEEGDLLYMPTTVEPGLSTTKAREILQQTDALIAEFPEVEHVFGKIGRAETATDPAPLNMIETTITLHDESQWRHVPVARFYHGWPEWLAAPFRNMWPDVRPITTDELIYGYSLPNGRRVPGMNDALSLPGLANSWTMPIRTRIDMLATGIKTPVGIKLMGEDLDTLSRVSQEIAQLMRTAPGLSEHTVSAYADRAVGGHYLDIDINRDAIARYGLTVEDVQMTISSAVGGMNVGATVEGLERYPINVRYPREMRDDVDALRQVLVAAPGNTHVPLGQLADISLSQGPPMIKSENARPTSWVYVDLAGTDVASFVARAQEVVAQEVQLPPGYTIAWSGQYEYLEEVWARLSIVIPLTAAAIVVLLYIATRSWLRVGIVLLAVPFSLVGAIWLVYLLDYEMSLAVVVGLIALAGLDAETGLVMLLYLETSYERFKQEGRLRNKTDLWWAVHDGAVKRIRPKAMTVATTFTGLLPLLWAHGPGAATMQRLAAPMVGGLATSFIMELLLYPVLFYLARRVSMRFSPAAPPSAEQRALETV